MNELKSKIKSHVRINNIDFNYIAAWRLLCVTYPDGRLETINRLNRDEANEAVGKILEQRNWPSARNAQTVI